ncbi:MAG: hypothetical protein EBY32_04550 [Proteobacteria bacterium]|nr:hypothetical protein [Pseudomonadota bacterium]
MPSTSKSAAPRKQKKLTQNAHGVDKCEAALAGCEALRDCNEDRAIPLTASLTFFEASAVIFEDCHTFFDNLAMRNNLAV